MKRNILTLFVLLAIGLLGAGYLAWMSRETPQPEPEVPEEVVEAPSPSPGTRTVQLFYYDPARDQDEAGNIMCSRDGLVPVARSIASMTPIEDTLRLLLTGELTAAERARGITTEYPLPGVEISSVALRADGLLRVELKDPNNRLVGGSCRTAVLAGQIVETAMQFQEVTSVEFIPDEVFQP